MSDRNEEPREVMNIEEPSWLIDEAKGDDSLKNVKKHKRVSALKIIQGQSSPELKKTFGEGSVIVPLAKVRIAKLEEVFQFEPFFFFEEYCQWSDLDDKESPMIVARTFDPSTEIAKKSLNKDLRKEPYKDGKFNYRFCHHLNFIGLVRSAEIDRFEALISFSRGEFLNGETFCTSCAMRKVGGMTAPLYSQVWDFKTTLRTRMNYSWYGFDFFPPAERKYCTQEEFPFKKKMYSDAKEVFDTSVIDVDYDEEPESKSTSGRYETDEL